MRLTPGAKTVSVSIALIDDDRVSRDQLAAALRGAGYEVKATGHTRTAWTLSHVTGEIEILINRSHGGHPGVRMVVTSVPTTEKYTGSWSMDLPAPATPAAVVVALRNMLPDPLH
jgi:hypothetical protein